MKAFMSSGSSSAADERASISSTIPGQCSRVMASHSLVKPRLASEAGKALKLPLRRRPNCRPISVYVPFRVRTFMRALDGSGDMRVSEDRGPDNGESGWALCRWRGWGSTRKGGTTSGTWAG
ncbi:hypothetical protein ES703_79475 [subsurface metagenome]